MTNFTHFGWSHTQKSNTIADAQLSFVAVPFFVGLQKCMQSRKKEVLESHTKKLLSILLESFDKRLGTSVEP